MTSIELFIQELRRRCPEARCYSTDKLQTIWEDFHTYGEEVETPLERPYPESLLKEARCFYRVYSHLSEQKTDKPQLNGPEKLFNRLRYLNWGKTEQIRLILLNHQLQEKKILLLARGSHDRVQCPAKSIFEAVLSRRAPAFALAHNHPSGNLEVSEDDIHYTREVLKMAQVLGLRFVDHLLIHAQAYTSMREKGLLYHT